MHTQLDIIGSVIVGGMLTLLFATFMLDKQQSEIETNSMVMNQTAMASIDQMIQFDLRKAGYKVSGSPYLVYQPKRLAFIGDLDDNGSIDTVRYWFATPVTSTPNPRDSLLYRQVNSETAVGTDMGLTDLQFRYLNSSGNETTDPALIRSVNVSMKIQSRFPLDGEYQDTYSDFRISPKNKK